ncbi:MAG: dephospho-CoA kinase [Nitrospirae bacterium]|nr:dephospho-CoA kinase [Nitrospirota bacterium]
MQTIGLTGGIATGKSTVARYLVQFGASLIDADEVAHEIILPGRPAYDEIVRAFGSVVLAADRAIDRIALGQIVFTDPQKRRLLNGITHPRIGESIALGLQSKAQSGCTICVVEAALLIENGRADLLRPMIVVSTDLETQIHRLMVRDRIARVEALAKIESQMPVAEKAKKADFVVDNSGPLESTYAQTREVWKKITEAPHL